MASKRARHSRTQTSTWCARRFCTGAWPRAISSSAGDVTRHAMFVASGCLRNYVIDAKGQEHIVQFAPETWWLADATSLHHGAPSQYFIDAIEDSDLLLIDGPSHQELVEKVAGYAAAFRTGLQRHAAAKDQRIVTSLSASAEERYLEFLRVYPSIALCVPQPMLASYLGMTPETVSRIRRRTQKGSKGSKGS